MRHTKCDMTIDRLSPDPGDGSLRCSRCSMGTLSLYSLTTDKGGHLKDLCPRCAAVVFTTFMRTQESVVSILTSPEPEPEKTQWTKSKP